MIKGMTQMVYHPGTKTSMALAECVILPVPNNINPDDIDSFLDTTIENFEQAVEQGTHLYPRHG